VSKLFEMRHRISRVETSKLLNEAIVSGDIEFLEKILDDRGNFFGMSKMSFLKFFNDFYTRNELKNYYHTKRFGIPLAHPIGHCCVEFRFYIPSKLSLEEFEKIKNLPFGREMPKGIVVFQFSYKLNEVRIMNLYGSRVFIDSCNIYINNSFLASTN
jgi:hypothetical protein